MKSAVWSRWVSLVQVNEMLGGNRSRIQHLLVGILGGLAAWVGAATAYADVDVGTLVERWQSRATTATAQSGDPFHVLSRRGDGMLHLLVTARATGTSVVLPVAQANLLPIHPGVYTWTANAEQVATFVAAHPELAVTWSAPRHVLLDQALPLVHADVAQRSYGLSGKGVAVGIVDTGLDIRHPDLRRADGSSRIAWLLDMSHDPVRLHPELEHANNCDQAETPCAVYSGADLDRLTANDVNGDEPVDTYGHGTHVASLAAGNGLGSAAPKYIGMAPEATIVAVRATRDASGIVEDPDILAAVKFIFDVAEQQLQQPAVVNLSLGGDFGAHDGTAKLETTLAAFVGQEHPGRSIVVAAGNSGLLYHLKDSPYPSPFGIHSVAQVPPESSVRVPILVGASPEPKLPSQLYIWVATRPGDRLKVGLETESGKWIAPVDVGPELNAKDPTGQYTATLQNGVTESDDPNTVDHSGAIVLIEGPFTDDKVFALRLEGHGTASIWLQPAGGIDPSANGFGALLPSAQREGTINIPGTSSEIIAVGAALNHLQWEDVAGKNQIASSYVADWLRVKYVMPFSSAGPTATDLLKPDLVAPGGYVVGAMSRLADPRVPGGEYSMFMGDEYHCNSASDTCLLVDDQHALSTGTSMASPIVAGAIALLLERDPSLTQPRILELLQAGASTVGEFYASPSQVGAGLLNVENALLALEGQLNAADGVSLDTSWLGLNDSYVRPDSNWQIAGVLHLRNAQDRPVAVDVARLNLAVTNGRVWSNLIQVSPGYYRFTLTGVERTAGQTFVVELRLDGKPLLRETRDIAVDSPNSSAPVVAGRDCALRNSERSSSSVGDFLLVLAVAVTLVRRRQRRVAS